MYHLNEFLIRLQTFELRLTTQRLYTDNVRGSDTNEADSYDLKHESGHYDAYPFKSALRVYKDMAIIDLLTANKQVIALALQQADKLQQRFKTFWIYYQNNYQNSQVYPLHYLDDLKLNDLFIVHNIELGLNRILVDGVFVDDLGESVKLRELFLMDLLIEVNGILNHEERVWTLNEGSAPAKAKVEFEPVEGIMPHPASIVKVPAFTGGTLTAFFEIFKNYFSLKDQNFLLPLLQENLKPESSLVFNGNGNQLADAFKQLYEANLIVGCAKADLEEWISSNFEYVYRNQRKTLPVNYLNSIISSNTKPCQSPILDLKKQQDGTLCIIPVLRGTKKQ